MQTILFHNANIVTPVDGGSPSCGDRQDEVRRIPEGAILSRNGVIEAVGPLAEIRAALPEDASSVGSVDLGGGCVIPGFVDPHTHMCFAKRREEEFGMRLAGSTYLEILSAGGGILSSVRAVKQASDEELLRVTLGNIESACRHGTTTLEIKSGYGLDTATELRMLRVIAEAGRRSDVTVVPTFMGAHAVPLEYKDTPDAFTDTIINEMLPAVMKESLASYCDVFCEQGVFTIDQGRRILRAARKMGLGLKIHADEIHDLGGAGLAAELHTISAEHLLAASDDNLDRMAASGTIAVLLPGTAYSLRKPYARALSMIEKNVPVAVATDCNPGSCLCESMPFVVGLAILNMGLNPEQALVAATLNAAYAIGEQHRAGSLEKGKNADFVVLNGEAPTILAYHAGVNPVAQVYKQGRLVAENSL